MTQDNTIGFGILGAAGIAPKALTIPARARTDVRLVTVAARDRTRAELFAREESVDKVAEEYSAVLADPEVDAIYIPLPNSEHGRWTIAALEAGKHVLVEKPFASNLAEAEKVAEVVRAHPGLVVMEAFHNRYHALFSHVAQLLADGVIGTISDASSTFHVSLPDRSNIRYNLALAGGSTMDLGCYPIHFLRTFFGEPEVLSAEARTGHDPKLDDALTAKLQFPGGITSTIESSLDEPAELQQVVIRGSRGSITVEGFVHPYEGNSVTVMVDGLSTTHEVDHEPTTYAAQLDAFVRAVRGEDTNLTGIGDSLATMRVIDACYEAAGLGPRPAPHLD